MLELSPATLVGKGLHREVHVHPDDDSKCVKVVVLRGKEETRREQAYYRFLQRRNIDWISLPQFYGNEETNMGPGAVFDLIRDDDRQVSKTLAFYLDNLSSTPELVESISQALIKLKRDLLEQNIITMTLKPKNMVLQLRNDGVRCLIIDNIGNSDIVPISSYVRFFGRKKIERKWGKFKQLLKRDDSQQQIEVICKRI
ncbi:MULTISPECIES: YrbL family protein [Methylophaga]|uniref:YrbL family protein n=1 Tax=Methylophaga TaxID=40222 RepID=UPI002353D102|nr:MULTISPECIES: YrbL family protein [Methylophaga]